MRRFVNRYRKAGITLLAVFAVQVMAAGFCAIPSVHAAPVTLHASTEIQCNMYMPVHTGHNTQECAHCKTPDFNTFSNQANDAPASWVLIAVLPTLLHRADTASEQEQPLFVASEGPPRSTSLIYQKTLRIRL